MDKQSKPHECAPENAELMLKWVRERGGVAVWGSINFSNLGASWTAPLNDEQGNRKPKPTWEAANEPERVITDPREIVVVVRREVKRFRIGVRRGGNGLSFKLTDASSRRVRAAVDKAGEDATYQFDYDTQEAVILVPDKTVPLVEFVEGRGDAPAPDPMAARFKDTPDDKSQAKIDELKPAVAEARQKERP